MHEQPITCESRGIRSLRTGGWRRWPLGALLAAALVVSGCSGAPTETVKADDVPPVAEGRDLIRAEAHVEPARWMEVEVAPDVGGTVTMAVEEGTTVREGDLLVQLATAEAELAVERAEAALAAADAELARVKAGTRPEEVAVTEARLEVARAEVAEAAARRSGLTAGETTADIAAAQAALAAGQAEEKQAFHVHERTMECFAFEWEGEKYTICPALGRPEETARYAWHASQGKLTAAEQELEAAENGAAARLRDANAGVLAAEARQSSIEAELDLQRAGSRLPLITAARAEVRKAEVALETARTALEKRAIRAAFDGTVAEMAVHVGDTAAPGQLVAVLAAVDGLQLQTIDLTELDVVRIEVGHPVTVTLDALPDRPLEGEVSRIADQAEDRRGDVTYPVTIQLAEAEQALRWGMTASVEMRVE